MSTLLQINSTANWGSTGRIAEEIGEHAAIAGWSSYIAFGRMAEKSKSKLFPIGNSLEIYLHGLESFLLDRHGLGSRQATHTLIRKLRSLKPDIIQLHNLHGYYLNYPILFHFLAEMNIPVVWTLHDCWSFTGHCAYFDFAGRRKWQTGCSSCPQIRTYPSSLFVDNCTFNWQLKQRCFNSIKNLTVVVVSEWLRSVVEKSFLNKYPCKVIYNGINTEVFKPHKEVWKIRQRLGIGEAFMLLGVASSWSSRKGFHDYLKLAEILPPNHRIVLVGLTPSMAKKLPKNVIGLPRTNSADELAELYSTADVVLNLSVEETFGLTTVEGFACGTPGIVYDCTASPELIDEKTGMVCHAGDLSAILAALKTLEKNGKQSYTLACRNRAVKLFNKNIQYEKYIDLYRELLIDRGKNV